MPSSTRCSRKKPSRWSARSAARTRSRTRAGTATASRPSRASTRAPRRGARSSATRRVPTSRAPRAQVSCCLFPHIFLVSSINQTALATEDALYLGQVGRSGNRKLLPNFAHPSPYLFIYIYYTNVRLESKTFPLDCIEQKAVRNCRLRAY